MTNVKPEKLFSFWGLRTFFQRQLKRQRKEAYRTDRLKGDFRMTAYGGLSKCDEKRKGGRKEGRKLSSSIGNRDVFALGRRRIASHVYVCRNCTFSKQVKTRHEGVASTVTLPSLSLPRKKRDFFFLSLPWHNSIQIGGMDRVEMTNVDTIGGGWLLFVTLKKWLCQENVIVLLSDGREIAAVSQKKRYKKLDLYLAVVKLFAKKQKRPLQDAISRRRRKRIRISILRIYKASAFFLNSSIEGCFIMRGEVKWTAPMVRSVAF